MAISSLVLSVRQGLRSVQFAENQYLRVMTSDAPPAKLLGGSQQVKQVRAPTPARRLALAEELLVQMLRYIHQLSPSADTSAVGVRATPTSPRNHAVGAASLAHCFSNVHAKILLFDWWFVLHAVLYGSVHFASARASVQILKK